MISKIESRLLGFVVGALFLSGCCLDIEANLREGNIITYERGKVCTDSTQRGLANSAKVCFSRVCKE